MNPLTRWKLAREADDFAEGTTRAAAMMINAEPLARLIIGDIRAGRAMIGAEVMARVDAFEKQHGPVGEYALVMVLARYAAEYGAPGDDTDD